MKKFLSLIIVLFMTTGFAFAIDRLSPEYLQSRGGFSLTRGFAERAVEKAIKKALKKETDSNFDVKFSGYSISSMKKGIFKSIELSGKDVKVDNLTVPYVHLKSLSDYNYIDYTQNPFVYKSDMTYAFDLLLDDDTINKALKDSTYNKVLERVNKIANPFFVIEGVKTKIRDNKLYVITEYDVPLSSKRHRSFVANSDFEVVNGVIKAKNVSIDSSYGNLGLNKVANLINYLNPLEFTFNLLEEQKHNAIIENVNIVDNKVKIDGKIYIKGVTGK